MDFANLTVLLSEYGPFVTLVAYILWDNNRRDKRSNLRESEFINETRVRESKYIEREEKYIEVIGSLTKSFEEIREDVSYIKNRVEREEEIK